jgi:uncharacterized phage protein (TIGR01671 family)
MREIKFRCWDKNWQGGGMREFGLGEFLFTERDTTINLDSVPVMQYAGLKDKNGIEIWEGDVLKVAEHYPASGGKWTQQIAAISFESGCFVIRSKKGLFSTLHGIASISEVIGNIHENPELIQCLTSTPA